MPNGDLYQKGQMLFHKNSGIMVEYVCSIGNRMHLVLATPLDCIDDRIREVRADQLAEYPPSLPDPDADCITWIRQNRVTLQQKYLTTIGALQRQGYESEGLVVDGGFLFYAIFHYEAQRLKGQMAPGSRTRQ